MAFYCYEVSNALWHFKFCFLVGTGLQIPPAAQQALQMSGSMVAMAAATGQFLVFLVIHVFIFNRVYVINVNFFFFQLL